MNPVFGLSLFGKPAAPAPAPAPTSSGELWVDASNYSGAFTVQQMRDLTAAGVVGVIPQAITGLNGVSYTAQQCQMAQSHGLKLMGYIWCFPGESTASIDARLQMFQGKAIRKLWVDVEQAGLVPADVDLILARSDHYLPTQSAGIYTGRWFFLQQGWDGLTRWSDRDLWDSNYDGIPDVAKNFKPYGGWDHCILKQYMGTSDVGHLHEIDLDAA